MPQEMPSLSDYLSDIDGIEVQTSGRIGYSDLSDGDLRLSIEDLEYRIFAVAALNREQLASIEGCQFKMFEDSACAADMKVELNFSSGRITAIVFDVENVVQPE